MAYFRLSMFVSYHIVAVAHPTNIYCIHEPAFQARARSKRITTWNFDQFERLDMSLIKVFWKVGKYVRHSPYLPKKLRHIKVQLIKALIKMQTRFCMRTIEDEMSIRRALLITI